MRPHRFAIAALTTSAALAVSPVLAADVGAEITTAAMHAGLAAQGSDIATVHTHLHHTVNCLVGPAGPGFDSKELNPCANAGNGAIPDSSDPRTKQALEAALAKANSGLGATDLAPARKDASDTEAMLKSVK
ncbi:MAG TPA: hypothetical protein VMF67_11280 [Rhizomicrobium sp.]|nr:hypothetical protein [Rhizomicrobium sp.]